MHTGLSAGDVRHYRVYAINAIGTGPASGTANATTTPVFADAALERSVAENSAGGVAVGAPVAATDSDGDTLSYTLSGPDAGSFAIDSSTGQISTRAGVSYDYETKPSYSVTVTAADDDGGTASVAVTIELENLPSLTLSTRQPRVLMTVGLVRFEVSSDVTPSHDLRVGYAGVQERQWFSDALISFSTAYYAVDLAWDLLDLFFLETAPIESGTVTISLQPGEGYELGTPSTQTVELVAADPSITVSATHDAYSIAEGGGNQTVTIRAQTIEGAPRPIEAVEMNWSTGPDSATGGGTDYVNANGLLTFLRREFSQSGTRWVASKQVSVTVVDDDAVEGDERLFVRLSRHNRTHRLIKRANADGTLCGDNAAGTDCGATITIVDDDGTNAPPVFADATPERSVAENSAGGVAVGAPVAATDSDGDTLSYTLSGPDAGSFAIDSSTGQISTRAGVSYDYETKPSWSVTVTADDGNGGTASAVVTIELENLPSLTLSTRQPRVLMTVGLVRFEVSSDVTPSHDLRVGYAGVQERQWFSDALISFSTAYYAVDLAWDLLDLFFLETAPIESGTVTISLQPGEGYELGTPSTQTVELVAADPSITVSATHDAYSIAEGGGNQTVTIRAQTIEGAPRPIEAVEMNWSTGPDSATGGGTDYVNANGLLTFLRREFSQSGTRWVASKQVSVTVVDDDAVEGDERLFVRLSRHNRTHRLIKRANADGTLCGDNAAGTDCGATVTIVDDDGTNAPPVFADATPERSVAENSAGGVAVGAPVAATDSDGDTLSYTLSGPDAGSFAIDSSTGQISTRAGVSYDYETKPSWSVTVTADDGNAGTASVPVTVIVTDVREQPGKPDAPSVEAKTPTSLTVRWTAPTDAGKSAITSYDLRYKAHGALNFIDGAQGQTDTVATLTDLRLSTVYEVQVRATNAEGDSEWSDTLRAVTQVPTVQVPGSITVAEEDGTVDVTLELDMPSTRPITVDYETVDRDAIAGTDYTATSGSLRFEAGETQQTISIEIVDDLVVEREQGFTIALSGVGDTEGTLERDRVRITITEGDTTTIAVPRRVSVQESNGTTEISLTLSAPIEYALNVLSRPRPDRGTATPDVDYASGSVVFGFPAGETETTLRIPIIDDELAEGDESFRVELFRGNGTDARIVFPDPDIFHVTIVDDDGPVLERGAVNGPTLVLTYHEDLDTGSVPPAGAFEVTVNGATRALAAQNAVMLSGPTAPP